MKLNKKVDLTRWNRAGLSEFRYVDGNAITFLEALRLQLVEEYDQSGKPQWKELLERYPELPDETRYQTKKRLNAQYYGERRDYAWEILRTFSRSAHILGEYINAYANEAYLPTAVEWDSLRKLVAMLDYLPSPPASAETYIALLYKENESGEVDKGFAVKNTPDAGAATVIFETQEKLEGNSSINQLHLKRWNKNSDLPYKHASGTKVRFYFDELIEDINVGDVGVLAISTNGVPVEVSLIENNESENYIDLYLLSENDLNGYTLYNSTLYLQPSFVSSPLANGLNSVTFIEDVGFTEDEIVFGENTSGWFARRVVRNELGHVEFEGGGETLENNEIFYRSRILRRQKHAHLENGNYVYLVPDNIPDGSDFFFDTELNKLPVSIQDDDVDSVLFRFIKMDPGYDEDIFYPDELAVGVIKQIQQTEVRFSGKAPEIESGSWAMVHHNDTITAHLVDDIAVDEDRFSISLRDPSTAVSLVRSAFKLSLKHKNYNVNNNSAWSSASCDSVSVLKLDDASLLENLTLGQKLICASDEQAFVVELKDVSISNSGVGLLHVSPAFHLDPDAASFTRNNMLVYGNAVRVTHGETQPEKIVGNGDASKKNQSFELTSNSISWVADAGFSTGVRADLSLLVGQRQWQQVEDLSLSAAEDHHYKVRVNEDTMLSVCFGDGRHGRRLPSGVDNVRVSYRDGYGEEGNLESNSLVKILRPHRLIEDFVAPLASSGGAEKESSESMRESAPATVLALSRAVSLDDFTHLASHHSMVWQARAFEKMPDRPARSLIEVVAVAAGGATFIPGSDTAILIQDYLVAHSAPGTPVSVISYSPLLMQLKLNIMVNDTAYDKKVVELAVIDHLKESLTIKLRKLGQPLFRSEVIALLEQIEGVENGHCEILDGPYVTLDAKRTPRLHISADGKIRKVSIHPDQLLYLDVESYPLQITIQAYEI
jgi:hypothetical protein